MDYETRLKTDHYETVDYDTGKVERHEDTVYSILVTYMTQEQFGKLMKVVHEIYKDDVQQGVYEEIKEYEEYKARKTAQDKGAL